VLPSNFERHAVGEVDCPQRGKGRQEPMLMRSRRARSHGIAFSEHYSGGGAIFYKHDCALGCEGIVSKRLGSPFHAGRAAAG
jgi:ATP-dependent DNA ligase